MKYLIVGAGAMGTALSGYLTNLGRDVTLIARGESLTSIKEKGVEMVFEGKTDFTAPVRAVSESDYNDTPDVVILCVKRYQLDTIIPLLDRISKPETIILPLINAVDLASTIEEKMSVPASPVNGVAYIALEIIAPGVVKRKITRFRIVFGPRNDSAQELARLERVQADLTACGADVAISDDMLQAVLYKFLRVSALSAAQVYFDVDVGGMRENPEAWQYYRDLQGELEQIAKVSGRPFLDDPRAVAEASVSTIDPTYITSLTHDYRRGRPTEAEAQFFDAYKLGRSFGLEMPAYGRVSEKMGFDVNSVPIAK